MLLWSHWRDERRLVQGRHSGRPSKRKPPRARRNGALQDFTYEDLIKRDKINLDIFWLKDESLEDSANLPDPGVIALEITEDLEAALAQFAEIAADLKQ